MLNFVTVFASCQYFHVLSTHLHLKAFIYTNQAWSHNIKNTLKGLGCVLDFGELIVSVGGQVNTSLWWRDSFWWKFLNKSPCFRMLSPLLNIFKIKFQTCWKWSYWTSCQFLFHVDRPNNYTDISHKLKQINQYIYSTIVTTTDLFINFPSQCLTTGHRLLWCHMKTVTIYEREFLRKTFHKENWQMSPPDLHVVKIGLTNLTRYSYGWKSRTDGSEYCHEQLKEKIITFYKNIVSWKLPKLLQEINSCPPTLHRLFRTLWCHVNTAFAMWS